MGGTEPGGQFLPARFRCPWGVALAMHPGESRVHPEEGQEGEDEHGRKDPRAPSSGVRRLDPLEPVKHAREHGETELPLEEAQEDGLRHAAGFTGGEGVLDAGSEHHGNGNEGDADTRAEPE